MAAMREHTIRWGILGTAKIARTTAIPAMHQASNAVVNGIASRSPEGAQGAAADLEIPHAFGSYDEMLASDEIDAVYIPLPNHLHVPWTLAALDAGKHVLCEKPLGLNAADAAQVGGAAERAGRLAMEGFMYRFHPQWDVVFAAIESGRIGELRAISVWFSYPKGDPATNVRYQRDWGGGVLMDIGCYCISSSRWLFGEEPTSVEGAARRDAASGVDVLTSGVLEFPSGHAVFTCGMEQNLTQRLDAIGTDGRISVDVPFNPPPDRSVNVHVTDAHGTETVQVAAANQFTLQVEAFSAAALGGEPVPTPLSDAVANMTAIDAVAASAG